MEQTVRFLFEPQFRIRFLCSAHGEDVPLGGSGQSTMVYYLHRFVAQRLVWWAGPGKSASPDFRPICVRVMMPREFGSILGYPL